MCPGKTIKVPGFAMQPSSFAEKHLCSLKSFDTNAQSQLLHLRCTLRKPGVWLLHVCSLVQFQFTDYFIRYIFQIFVLDIPKKIFKLEHLQLDIYWLTREFIENSIFISLIVLVWNTISVYVARAIACKTRFFFVLLKKSADFRFIKRE